MYKRKFDVTIPKSSKTRCFTCHHQISKQEIRISFKKYDHFRYFHLNCFDPPALYYLKPSNLNVTLSKEPSALFKSWLLDWNKQFFPLNPEIPYKIKSFKVLKTRKTIQSNIFSLIFEYLSINDIVNYCEFVSKSFYHAAWEANLWKSLLFRDFQSNPQTRNPRLEYIQENFERCLVCKQKPENLQRNELLERNLCKICKKITINSKELFEKTIKSSAEMQFGFYFDQRFNRLKTFDGCTKGNYFFYYLKVAERVRRENRAEIIEKLERFIQGDHEFLRIIRKVDLGLLDFFSFDHLLKDYGEKYFNQLKIVFKIIKNKETGDFSEEELVEHIIKGLNIS